MKPALFAFALAAAFSATSAQAMQSVNLLTNGSFETPAQAAIGNYFFNTGSIDITGWTVVGGQTQLSYHSTCTDGNQCIDLTGIVGYDKGLQSDAVATVIGTTYQLSFDLGNVDYPGFYSSTVSVSINNGAATLFTNVFNYDPSGFEWERKSFSWLADAASAQITILGAANGSLSNDQGILLDNVAFTAAPVPEPETYALLLAGLGLVGFAVRRRSAPAL
jgi:hypothetical protein